MPDSPSNDDKFADLFDRLPDPAARPAPAAAPGSRRAAREAALTATGHHAVPPRSEPATPSPAENPVPAAATSAPASPAVAPDAGPNESGTLDALFAAEHARDRHAQQHRHDRDARKSRVAKWVVLFVVLAMIGGVVAGGVWVWNTYETQIRELFGWTEPADYETGEATGEATITIIEGDTGADVSVSLFEAGVTKTRNVFYDHLIATAQNTDFIQPGSYALQQRMTAAAALEALRDPANKQENTAQLREGLTVAQSLPLLAEGIGLEQADLEAAVADPSAYGVEADSLEGWLFPATYTFDPGITAEGVIQTLVDRTRKSLSDAGVPEDRHHEILTIASIIQKEARYEEDFYKVSRVIQNRLSPDNTDTGGRLEMDSTAQYGVGEDDGTVSSTEDALTDDNPWNTYVHAGLPVGPISNPGDMAIDAAMHPADGPWMYFVTVNLDTGETVFTETLAEHEAAVAQWDSWCEDNPDSGC
ncbi:endolytic transglycosylase MltG [Microbacterium sp. bgisy189]|uniref:endolytic transglycosylase MltG n=1 Tax=Microbacterium sp. bgisy189 TaxID=3413798 RepID=UPI003EBFD63D